MLFCQTKRATYDCDLSRHTSQQEKIFLKALLADFQRTGVEEVIFNQVYKQHVSLCRFDGKNNSVCYSAMYVLIFCCFRPPNLDLTPARDQTIA